jgi:hypothetical protein
MPECLAGEEPQVVFVEAAAAGSLELDVERAGLREGDAEQAVSLRVKNFVSCTNGTTYPSPVLRSLEFSLRPDFKLKCQNFS